MSEPVEIDLRVTMLSAAWEYAKLAGCGLSTVGRRCRNDCNFFARLADETRSFRLRTFDEVMDWFEANWPAEARV